MCSRGLLALITTRQVCPAHAASCHALLASSAARPSAAFQHQACNVADSKAQQPAWAHSMQPVHAGGGSVCRLGYWPTARSSTCSPTTTHVAALTRHVQHRSATGHTFHTSCSPHASDELLQGSRRADSSMGMHRPHHVPNRPAHQQQPDVMLPALRQAISNASNLSDLSSAVATATAALQPYLWGKAGARHVLTCQLEAQQPYTSSGSPEAGVSQTLPSDPAAAGAALAAVLQHGCVSLERLILPLRRVQQEQEGMIESMQGVPAGLGGLSEGGGEGHSEDMRGRLLGQFPGSPATNINAGGLLGIIGEQVCCLTACSLQAHSTVSDGPPQSTAQQQHPQQEQPQQPQQAPQQASHDHAHAPDMASPNSHPSCPAASTKRGPSSTHDSVTMTGTTITEQPLKHAVQFDLSPDLASNQPQPPAVVRTPAGERPTAAAAAAPDQLVQSSLAPAAQMDLLISYLASCSSLRFLPQASLASQIADRLQYLLNTDRQSIDEHTNAIAKGRPMTHAPPAAALTACLLTLDPGFFICTDQQRLAQSLWQHISTARAPVIANLAWLWSRCQGQRQVGVGWRSTGQSKDSSGDATWQHGEGKDGHQSGADQGVGAEMHGGQGSPVAWPQLGGLLAGRLKTAADQLHTPVQLLRALEAAHVLQKCSAGQLKGSQAQELEVAGLGASNAVLPKVVLDRAGSVMLQLRPQRAQKLLTDPVAKTHGTANFSVFAAQLQQLGADTTTPQGLVDLMIREGSAGLMTSGSALAGTINDSQSPTSSASSDQPPASSTSSGQPPSSSIEGSHLPANSPAFTDRKPTKRAAAQMLPATPPLDAHGNSTRGAVLLLQQLAHVPPEYAWGMKAVQAFMPPLLNALCPEAPARPQHPASQQALQQPGQAFRVLLALGQMERNLSVCADWAGWEAGGKKGKAPSASRPPSMSDMEPVLPRLLADEPGCLDKLREVIDVCAFTLTDNQRTRPQPSWVDQASPAQLHAVATAAANLLARPDLGTPDLDTADALIPSARQWLLNPQCRARSGSASGVENKLVGITTILDGLLHSSAAAAERCLTSLPVPAATALTYSIVRGLGPDAASKRLLDSLASMYSRQGSGGEGQAESSLGLSVPAPGQGPLVGQGPTASGQLQGQKLPDKGLPASGQGQGHGCSSQREAGASPALRLPDATWRQVTSACLAASHTPEPLKHLLTSIQLDSQQHTEADLQQVTADSRVSATSGMVPATPATQELHPTSLLLTAHLTSRLGVACAKLAGSMWHPILSPARPTSLAPADVVAATLQAAAAVHASKVAAVPLKGSELCTTQQISANAWNLHGASLQEWAAQAPTAWCVGTWDALRTLQLSHLPGVSRLLEDHVSALLAKLSLPDSPPGSHNTNAGVPHAGTSMELQASDWPLLFHALASTPSKALPQASPTDQAAGANLETLYQGDAHPDPHQPSVAEDSKTITQEQQAVLAATGSLLFDPLGQGLMRSVLPHISGMSFTHLGPILTSIHAAVAAAAAPAAAAPAAAQAATTAALSAPAVPAAEATPPAVTPAGQHEYMQQNHASPDILPEAARQLVAAISEQAVRRPPPEPSLPSCTSPSLTVYDARDRRGAWARNADMEMRARLRCLRELSSMQALAHDDAMWFFRSTFPILNPSVPLSSPRKLAQLSDPFGAQPGAWSLPTLQLFTEQVLAAAANTRKWSGTGVRFPEAFKLAADAMERMPGHLTSAFPSGAAGHGGGMDGCDHDAGICVHIANVRLIATCLAQARALGATSLFRFPASSLQGLRIGIFDTPLQQAELDHGLQENAMLAARLLTAARELAAVSASQLGTINSACLLALEPQLGQPTGGQPPASQLGAGGLSGASAKGYLSLGALRFGGDTVTTLPGLLAAACLPDSQVCLPLGHLLHSSLPSIATAARTGSLPPIEANLVLAATATHHLLLQRQQQEQQQHKLQYHAPSEFTGPPLPDAAATQELLSHAGDCITPSTALALLLVAEPSPVSHANPQPSQVLPHPIWVRDAVDALTSAQALAKLSPKELSIAAAVVQRLRAGSTSQPVSSAHTGLSNSMRSQHPGPASAVGVEAPRGPATVAGLTEPLHRLGLLSTHILLDSLRRATQSFIPVALSSDADQQQPDGAFKPPRGKSVHADPDPWSSSSTSHPAFPWRRITPPSHTADQPMKAAHGTEQQSGPQLLNVSARELVSLLQPLTAHVGQAWDPAVYESFGVPARMGAVAGQQLRTTAMGLLSTLLKLRSAWWQAGTSDRVWPGASVNILAIQQLTIAASLQVLQRMLNSTASPAMCNPRLTLDVAVSSRRGTTGESGSVDELCDRLLSEYRRWATDALSRCLHKRLPAGVQSPPACPQSDSLIAPGPTAPSPGRAAARASNVRVPQSEKAVATQDAFGSAAERLTLVTYALEILTRQPADGVLSPEGDRLLREDETLQIVLDMLQLELSRANISHLQPAVLTQALMCFARHELAPSQLMHQVVRRIAERNGDHHVLESDPRAPGQAGADPPPALKDADPPPAWGCWPKYAHMPAPLVSWQDMIQLLGAFQRLPDGTTTGHDFMRYFCNRYVFHRFPPVVPNPFNSTHPAFDPSSPPPEELLLPCLELYCQPEEWAGPGPPGVEGHVLEPLQANHMAFTFSRHHLRSFLGVHQHLQRAVAYHLPQRFPYMSDKHLLRLAVLLVDLDLQDPSLSFGYVPFHLIANLYERATGKPYPKAHPDSDAPYPRLKGPLSRGRIGLPLVPNTPFGNHAPRRPGVEGGGGALAPLGLGTSVTLLLHAMRVLPELSSDQTSWRWVQPALLAATPSMSGWEALALLDSLVKHSQRYGTVLYDINDNQAAVDLATTHSGSGSAGSSAQGQSEAASGLDQPNTNGQSCDEHSAAPTTSAQCTGQGMVELDHSHDIALAGLDVSRDPRVDGAAPVGGLDALASQLADVSRAAGLDPLLLAVLQRVVCLLGSQACVSSNPRPGFMAPAPQGTASSFPADFRRPTSIEAALMGSLKAKKKKKKKGHGANRKKVGYDTDHGACAFDAAQLACLYDALGALATQLGASGVSNPIQHASDADDSFPPDDYEAWGASDDYGPGRRGVQEAARPGVAAWVLRLAEHVLQASGQPLTAASLGLKGLQAGSVVGGVGKATEQAKAGTEQARGSRGELESPLLSPLVQQHLSHLAATEGMTDANRFRSLTFGIMQLAGQVHATPAPGTAHQHSQPGAVHCPPLTLDSPPLALDNSSALLLHLYGDELGQLLARQEVHSKHRPLEPMNDI